MSTNSHSTSVFLESIRKGGRLVPPPTSIQNGIKFISPDEQTLGDTCQIALRDGNVSCAKSSSLQTCAKVSLIEEEGNQDVTRRRLTRAFFLLRVRSANPSLTAGLVNLGCLFPCSRSPCGPDRGGVELVAESCPFLPSFLKQSIKQPTGNDTSFLATRIWIHEALSARHLRLRLGSDVLVYFFPF